MVNANFRAQKMDEAVAIVLIFVLLLTAYNSYLMQSITEIYEIKYKFSALLTLHVLNVVSVLLIESMAYVQEFKPAPTAKTAPAPTPVKTETAPAPIIKPKAESGQFSPETAETFPAFGRVTAVKNLHEKGLKQSDIARNLGISQSTISRIINQIENEKQQKMAWKPFMGFHNLNRGFDAAFLLCCGIGFL